ncbi:MAG: hypothetical protein H0X03_06090 [Nitrosopumilus sp.]|nr:hypothetical protein [Nitrosopumilus sp.]
MSPFNFFKRKEKDISKIANNISKKSKSSHQSDNIISINFALEEIKKKETIVIKNHLDKLRKICEGTKQSYEIINNIADNIELEEINVEEEKLTPLINNTKKIIVKSLKRESSNILHIPETFDELTKFKEAIISSINRFGEVTSSHNKVINTFMKKHANSLRSELKKITENSEKINKGYNDILEDKETIDECRNNLLDVLKKRTESKNNYSIMDSIDQNIKEIENQNYLKAKELEQLRSLPSYSESLDHLKEIEELENNKEKLIDNILEISNQISKAAHKYSYGTSKGTKEIINITIKEPIRIIDDVNTLPYLEFLKNLKESINKNNILLKDSNKVLSYCDKMIETLPKFRDETKEIILRIKFLKDHNKNSFLEKIRKIEEFIDENKKSIQAENSRKEEFNKRKDQDEEKLEQVMNKIEEQLFYICKKRYKIAPN